MDPSFLNFVMDNGAGQGNSTSSSSNSVAELWNTVAADPQMKNANPFSNMPTNEMVVRFKVCF